jgi:hypothetical protein
VRHPDWCVIHYCTATGYTGAHRSAPVRIEDVRVTVNLYSVSATPDVVLVEVRDPGRLLPARSACALGRVLTVLGKVAQGAS